LARDNDFLMETTASLQRGLPPWSWKSLPFLGVHVAAFVLPFFVPFSWGLVLLALAFYWLRMFAVTAAYHRYLSHRTFKTSRVFQFILVFIACTSLQKGPLWWAAHHRRHHRLSDQEGDVHSPVQQGFLWAHVGWILARDWEETEWKAIQDFAKYPELVWMNNWHAVPGVLLAVTIYAIGGLPWLVWGFFVSTVINWHITFMINSLAHVFGRRRYPTKDDSRNSFILAILTLGEGWHNNHHHYQSSTRQGFFWWEVDVTYYILRAMALVGLVWDLREPPAHVVEGKLRKAAA
jgi:stearoyl-CoA desaturase (Delta-9 desaturase)